MAVEEELTCAICFDTFAERTPLPCSCKIDYCTRCWDRALCQSFRTVRSARCPTCRSPVHVDFDPEHCRLVFSLDTRPPPDLDGLGQLYSRTQRGDLEAQAQLQQRMAEMQTTHNATVERLANQAIPAQRLLLEQFGEAHLILRAIARSEDHAAEALAGEPLTALCEGLARLGVPAEEGVPRPELLARLQRAAGGSWPALAAFWVSRLPGGPLPSCVCGDSFQRMTGQERVVLSLQYANVVLGSPQFAASVRKREADNSCGVLCDLCDAKPGWTSFVWTCQGGAHTMLHAMCYDICEGCFFRHALAVDDDAQSQHR